MKQTILGTAIACVLLAAAGTAHAQLPAVTRLMSITGSYITAKEPVLGTMDGAAFNIGFESIEGAEGNVGVGFLVSFSRVSEEADANNFAHIDTWVTYGVLKYYKGTSLIQGYAGVALGAQFTAYERYVGGVELPRGSDAGLAVGVPVGLYLLVTDKVFLSANYSFNYLGNSFFEDDIAQAASVGVVFALD